MKNDMEDEKLRMMMLDIDGILTRYGADTTEVLAAAERMAVAAIGDFINRGVPPAKVHTAADAVTSTSARSSTPASSKAASPTGEEAAR